jgi:hypothetical protein
MLRRPGVQRVDQGEDVVGEAAGEAGEFGPVVLAPAGERLVEDPAPSRVRGSYSQSLRLKTR